jgi:hypothetical protein
MALRFRNASPERAQLRLRQGALRGTWTVDAGGSLECASEAGYVVGLTADLGTLRYELPVLVRRPWRRLVIVRRFGDGQPPFEVIEEDSRRHEALEIENTLKERLSVSVKRSVPALATLAALEQWECRAIDMTDALEARAIVDGFVTDAITCQGLDHTLEAAVERRSGRPLLRLVS